MIQIEAEKLIFWLDFGRFSFAPSYALWFRPNFFVNLKSLNMNINKFKNNLKLIQNHAKFD